MNTKQMTRLAAIAAILFVSLSFVSRSAYLDDDSGIPRTREIARPEPILGPILPPRGDDPLHRLLRHIEVGRPYSYGRLTVFPLALRNRGNAPDIRTLDEALSHGWITIREQEHAQVSEVVVRNESVQPVFLMAGEILGGGRQDRIIRNDVLVRLGQDPVSVPVYCVEQDRWNGPRASFDRAPYLAGQAMRNLAARAAPQDAIWTEVDHQLKQSGVSAPTRSYQSLYSDRDTSRRIDTVVERFRDLRTGYTVGLVIVDPGRGVSGDVFGDPDICARLWDKIIRSHAADVVLEDQGRGGEGIMAEPSLVAVRRFLEELSSAEPLRETTPGAGESFALRGRVDGHMLVWNGDLVHVAAIGPDDVHPLPPEPRPMPMPGPRPWWH